MKRHLRTLAAAALLAALASGAAGAGEKITGPVKSITDSWVTLNDRTWKLPVGTPITPLFGDDEIDPATIEPGTQIEIELDDAGEPMRVRAMVMR
jgi:hypothetical protein